MTTLTDEQLKKFEKHAPSQYRRPDFYWRGGDILKEQEFLRDERKHAVAQLHQGQRRLQQLKDDVSDANEVLREREGYTNALASYLERDVSASVEEAEMKRRLQQLEADIIENDTQLNELKKNQNPAVASAIQKETAYYVIEIQRMMKLSSNNEEQEDEAQNQMAACTVNGRYREYHRLEYDLSRALAKKSRLTQVVRQTKIEFETLRTVPYHNDEESKIERAALRRNIDTTVERIRMEDVRQRRTAKRRQLVSSLIDQIAELNDRMRDVGLGNKRANVEELRSRMLPSLPPVPPPNDAKSQGKSSTRSKRQVSTKAKDPPKPAPKPKPRPRTGQTKLPPKKEAEKKEEPKPVQPPQEQKAKLEVPHAQPTKEAPPAATKEIDEQPEEDDGKAKAPPEDDFGGTGDFDATAGFEGTGEFGEESKAEPEAAGDDFEDTGEFGEESKAEPAAGDDFEDTGEFGEESKAEPEAAGDDFEDTEEFDKEGKAEEEQEEAAEEDQQEAAEEDQQETAEEDQQETAEEDQQEAAEEEDQQEAVEEDEQTGEDEGGGDDFDE